MSTHFLFKHQESYPINSIFPKEKITINEKNTVYYQNSNIPADPSSVAAGFFFSGYITAEW